MDLLEKIVEKSSIVINEKKYEVLGKALYVSKNAPDEIYAKILLDEHYVLVLVPSDQVAYLGQNKGCLSEFNSFSSSVEFTGKVYKQVNHDYQIMIKLEFGSPLEVEGEVLYWDYEVDSDIISIAIVSRNQERADVVGHYIAVDDIIVI